LVLADVAEPVAADGQVVIDVHACAVNFPDVLTIQKLYQRQPPLPFTPGSEVAGVVSSLGPGVSSLKVGDAVFAALSEGGLADKAVLAADGCIPIPAGIDMVHACGFMYGHGTSHHGLKDRAALAPGEFLVVLGAAGGVGLAAVELGALMGARVIAAASSDEKLALCREYGAEMTINYATEDLKARIRELTGGHGADVVYDAVGGDYAEPALRSMATNGRFLVIGFAAGTIPKIPLNLVLLKECQVVGVFWGSFVAREPLRHQANVDELVAWWRDGRLRPHVSATFPLERSGEAMRMLADRKAVGRVVVKIR
jgi:NADPH:quinone reductase